LYTDNPEYIKMMKRITLKIIACKIS